MKIPDSFWGGPMKAALKMIAVSMTLMDLGENHLELAMKACHIVLVMGIALFLISCLHRK